MSRIFAIIVTYNGETYIEKCLHSLLTGSLIPEIVVIDNKSHDLTVNIIETYYSNIHLIKSSVNHGFGKANNIGLKFAYDNNADYIFLLNQDAWVEPDTIQKLVDISSHSPDFYVLSPVHLNKEGSDFDKGFMQYALSPFCENWFFDLYSSTEKDLYSTTFVNAAAWLMKREAISQIGFFDPLFFHYGEDKDYCNRILFHKKKIGIAANSLIHHSREIMENKNKGEESSLKKEINKNYFRILIEMKRPDKVFTKLIIIHSLGLFYSSFKKVITLQFYRSLIDILTLFRLLTEIPALASHRKECFQTGASFIESIEPI